MKHFITVLFAIFSLPCFGIDNPAAGKTITTANGDVITFSAPQPKNLHIANTNQNKMIEYGMPRPVLLNNIAIYYVQDSPDDTVNNYSNYQKWVKDHNAVNEMIDAVIENEKRKLPPGSYEFELKNMVINATGKVAYYETEGLVRRRYSETTRKKAGKLIIPANIEEKIVRKLKDVLSNATYTPIIISGVATPYHNYFTYTFSKQK